MGIAHLRKAKMKQLHESLRPGGGTTDSSSQDEFEHVGLSVYEMRFDEDDIALCSCVCT